jgi:hypothetical protein
MRGPVLCHLSRFRSVQLHPRCHLGAARDDRLTVTTNVTNVTVMSEALQQPLVVTRMHPVVDTGQRGQSVDPNHRNLCQAKRHHNIIQRPYYVTTV